MKTIRILAEQFKQTDRNGDMRDTEKETDDKLEATREAIDFTQVTSRSTYQTGTPYATGHDRTNVHIESIR